MKHFRENINFMNIFKSWLISKKLKCISKFIPTKIIENILEEKDEFVNWGKGYWWELWKIRQRNRKYGSIEQLKIPREYNSVSPIVCFLSDLNEKKDPRVQALCRRSSRCNICIFIFNPDHCESPKRTILANVNINHISKPNSYRDVQKLYQDKTSMDMTLIVYRIITSTCWNERHQTLTYDRTEVKCVSRYRLGFYSIIVPHTNLF